MRRVHTSPGVAICLLIVLGMAGASGVLSGRAEHPDAARQAASTGGFVSLFDGTLKDWTVENGNSFRVREGVLHVEGPAGWLRSAREYRNFVLRAEARLLTPDADSGLFVRAVGASIFMRGWPGDSYQVQVRVPTAPGPLPPIGGIFRHGTPPGTNAVNTDLVRKTFTGVGEWQRLEVEVSGTVLLVRLNGVETTRAESLVDRAGFVGIQAETGAVDYRAIEIRELP